MSTFAQLQLATMVRLLPTILIVIMLLSHIEKTTQEPFCVSSSSNINGPSIIDFDAECFEPGGEPSGFDLVTDTFSPPYTGLYWLHFTAGLPDNGDLTDVQLALPTRTINIYRSSGGPVAVSSRSDIVELTAGVDRLQLSSAGGQFSNVSDVQVSWSGFHLDSTMSNVAAFSVAMSPGTHGASYIPFDVVFVDTHSGWNYDHYTIPVSGLWVMSLHICNHPQQNYTVAYLNLKPVSEYPGFGVSTGFNYGADMSSVTIVAKGNAGEMVTGAVVLDMYVYSDFHYQTAMSGFLYSPTVQPTVAWTAVLSTAQYGPRDPAWFGTVLVNEGNGFDVSNSRFHAPHGGLYYVALAGEGDYDGIDMKMELLLNGNMKASVYYDKENRYGMTRSRAIILRLSVGDELRVRIPAGYHVGDWSYPDESTAFTGFRISP